VTALCIFDTLRGGLAARRSRPLISRSLFRRSSAIRVAMLRRLGPPLLTRGRSRSLPCLRLAAPVENRDRPGFASLASRVFALPRRSRRMVSSRAYSSPAPQPASRHGVNPFLINSNTLTRHLDRHSLGDGGSAEREGGSNTQTLKNSNTL